MKKVILLIALAVGVTANVVAQSEIKFGARAGLNFANLRSDDNTSDARVGFHVGGVADIPFTLIASDDVMKYFYFQPGLMITTKGYKNEIMGVSVKARPTYLELPLNFCFVYPINNDIRICANVGPYLAVGLLGKVKYDTDLITDYDYFSDDNAKRFDFGLNFGVSGEWAQYVLGLSYDLGLTDISHSDINIKNGAFMITLGYNF